MKTLFVTLMILTSFSASATRVRDGYGMKLKDYHQLLSADKQEEASVEADETLKADSDTIRICKLKTKRDGTFKGEGETDVLAEMDARKNCQNSYAQGCSTGKVKCLEFLNY